MIERCRGCGVDWETLEHPYEGLNCIDCRPNFGESEWNFWAPGVSPDRIHKANEKARQVAVMRRRGLTNSQIARRVGAAERTIFRAAQRWTEMTGEVLPRRETRVVPHAWDPTTGRYRERDLDGPLAQKILALKRAGKSHDAVSREVNMSMGTIKAYVRLFRERGDL